MFICMLVQTGDFSGRDCIVLTATGDRIEPCRTELCYHASVNTV